MKVKLGKRNEFYLRMTPFDGKKDCDSAGWRECPFPFGVTDVIVKSGLDCLISFGWFTLADLFELRANKILHVNHKNIDTVLRIRPLLRRIQVKAWDFGHEKMTSEISRKVVEVHGYYSKPKKKKMRREKVGFT